MPLNFRPFPCASLSLSLAAALLWAAAPRALAVPAGEGVAFNRDVRPILSEACFQCHGFDSKKRKGGLRLDTAEGAMAPDKDGVVAVKPGDPDHSELLRRIASTDGEVQMPPPSTHKTVSKSQKETLRRWIAQGARYQRHWAFEPPVQARPPAVSVPGWCRNPIDRFILARLDSEGLRPSPEADRRVLLRRVTFDLTGLPPTPAEVDAFIADKDPGAYDRVVDRLLSSPHFGERQAQSWLDLARYADTHGLHLDNERQTWAYRDWVARAFNRNEPFDQFTRDQLAGDLLPEPTTDQRIATGFNRCNVTTSEGGAIDAEFYYRYAVDRAVTTAETWMGLTAGCCVCHDHKFDPISTREFYSLYAFFYSAADPAMDGNALLTEPTLKLKTPTDERRLADWAERIAASEKRYAAARDSFEYHDPADARPAPPVRQLETVWLDDAPATGWTATEGSPQWVDSVHGPVKRGTLALRRQEDGVGQSVFEGAAAPFEVPVNARLFAHVYLEADRLPRAVLLQFKTDSWEHRALWGDGGAISWGELNQPSRRRVGDLPEAGKWVRLEIAAADVGLKPGDKITGVAFTQHGGVVSWDYAGFTGIQDPIHDPRRSFAAWLKETDGKDLKDLPSDARHALKEVAADHRTAEQTQALRNFYVESICADAQEALAPLRAAKEKLVRERDDYLAAIPGTFVWRDRDTPRDSFVMIRGQYDKPGDPVVPGVPAALPPIRKVGRLNRLDLADWLTRPDHPLTARVTVNRFWQQLFGTGLVKTSYDFGTQGDAPSHQELLDWLAVNYVSTGWDTKAMLRLMVTSAAYRQTSAAAPDLWSRDPENRLLARGPRFRLDAEEIRDNALYVSGLMSVAMGGPGVRPYQPPNIWEPVAYSGSNTREYRQDHGEKLYRRSLYTFLKRTAPAPYLAAFDAPNREQFCSRRERGDTPLQALLLLNDEQHFEAARALAERVVREGGPAFERRLDRAFELVLARTPTPAEAAAVRSFFDARLARYRSRSEAAELAIHNGESPLTTRTPAPELAAWALTANLLLNLDETLTRN